MNKQIKTEKETIQYLADVNHLRDLIIELKQYLKKRVSHSQDENGDIHYGCDCDPHDDDIHDRKKFFIKFCNRKRLDWAAVNKILFDEMSSFLCDYDLIYDLEIDDRGIVLYK